MFVYIFLIFLILPVGIHQECSPGLITGFSCLTPRDTVEQHHSTIEELKMKLITAHKYNGERIQHTRQVILKSIADATNFINKQILKLKNNMNEAKTEAIGIPISIQTCITSQDLEAGKIRMQSLTHCNSPKNFTKLEAIRNKFLKLSQALTTLGTNCILLNPLNAPGNNNVEMCILHKMKETTLQLFMIQEEFENYVQDILVYSSNCILMTSVPTFEKIGSVLGVIKSCGNLHGLRIKC